MSNSFLRSTLQYIILGLIILSPIFFISQSLIILTPFKLFTIAAISTITFILLLFTKIKTQKFFVSKNPLILSFLFVGASMLLSTFFSDVASISLYGRQISIYSFTFFASLAMLSYVVFQLFENNRQTQAVSVWVYLSSLLAIFINFLFVLLPFLPSFGFFFNNTINTIGTVTHLGLFIVFGIISSLIVIHFLSEQKLYKILGYIGVLMGLIFLVIINIWSMFVLLALFCVIKIIVDISVAKRSGELEKHLSYPTLAVLVFSIVFMLIGSKLGFILNNTFNMQSLEIRPNITNTLLVNQGVITQESFSNKLFGVGPNRFEVAWLQYRPVELNTTRFWDADFKQGFSYILSVGATQGVVGLVAWILFVLFSLLYVIKAYGNIYSTSVSGFVHIFSTTGFLFFLFVIFFYNPSIILLALFFIFFGMFIRTLYSLGLLGFFEKDISTNPRNSFVYILVIIAMLIVSTYVLYMHVIQYASYVVFENAKKEFQTTQDVNATFGKIQTAKFLFDSDIYELGLIDLMFFELNNTFKDNTLTKDQATSRTTELISAIATSSNIILMADPKSYTNHITVLNIYKNLASLGIQDAPDQAMKLIDKIATFTPNNPTLLLERANIAALRKDLTQSEKYIQEALSMKPNFTQAAFFLTQIQIEKGQINQAIESTKIIISQNQFEPTLYFQLGILYYSQQKFTDATGAFQTALTLNPNFANAAYFLGLSQYKTDKKAEAIKIFETLKTIFPDNTEVKQVLLNMQLNQDPLAGIITSPTQNNSLPITEEVEVKQVSEE
jgi:tetratricopeptide (TPR) repeat protein